MQKLFEYNILKSVGPNEKLAVTDEFEKQVSVIRAHYDDIGVIPNNYKFIRSCAYTYLRDILQKQSESNDIKLIDDITSSILELPNTGLVDHNELKKLKVDPEYSPFAKWQKIAVPNDRGSMTEFVVYRDTYYNQPGNENLYHIGNIERRVITEVSLHLHGAESIKDLDKACIGCQRCTKGECCEYDDDDRGSDIITTQDAKIMHCIHARALITYLKNRPDNYDKDYNEHVGRWESNFDVERRLQ